MGHLVNPISVRLSINTFWNSNWVLINNFNYVNLFKKDYLLFYFLNWFTKKTKFLKFNIVVSHYKIYKVAKKTYINLYYYNSNLYNNNTFVFLEKIININDKLELKNVQNNLFFLQEFIVKKLVFVLYWKNLNNSLNFFFNKIDNINSFYFNIYSLDFFNISVNAISTYLSLKLQKRYSLDWVLKPILKDLNVKIRRRNFIGYKIVCSGRFTRKQIATYMWMKGGSLKLNTLSNLIKYSEIRVRLKYGLCGIKIWINYGSNNRNLSPRNLSLIYPLYIPFKYVLEKNNNSIIFYYNSWFHIFIRTAFLKSKNFGFYKNYLNIKIKLLLNVLLEKIFNNFYLGLYELKILDNNKFLIKPKIKQINYLSFYKKLGKEFSTEI